MVHKPTPEEVEAEFLDAYARLARSAATARHAHEHYLEDLSPLRAHLEAQKAEREAVGNTW